MIHLRRKVEGRPPDRASTNNEDFTQQLEEQGYERLTKGQLFCQITAPNIILDPIIPFICGAISFFLLGKLGDYNLWSFMAAYCIADAVASLLEPLQR